MTRISRFGHSKSGTYVHAVTIYENHDESVPIHSLLHIVNLLQKIIKQSVAGVICLLRLRVSLAKHVHIYYNGHSSPFNEPE